MGEQSRLELLRSVSLLITRDSLGRRALSVSDPQKGQKSWNKAELALVSDSWVILDIL